VYPAKQRFRGANRNQRRGIIIGSDGEKDIARNQVFTPCCGRSHDYLIEAMAGGNGAGTARAVTGDRPDTPLE